MKTIDDMDIAIEPSAASLINHALNWTNNHTRCILAKENLR